MQIFVTNEAQRIAQVLEAKNRVSPTHAAFYRGCLKRRKPYGSIEGIKKSSEIFPRIPRSEWKDRIKEGQGTFLGDLTRGKLPPHDQNGTSLCWMHGSVRALEVVRFYQQHKALLLSAECAASQVTGGRDRGGYPEEALEQLRTVGTCDQTLWPINQLNESRALPGWQADQKNHIILKWLDLENFDDQITLAFHRIPIGIGLRWWSHLVCQLDPVILPDGSIGIGIDNSWGPDWGENGYGILSEKYGTADLGAFAPYSETFSEN